MRTDSETRWLADAKAALTIIGVLLVISVAAAACVRSLLGF
ncbi:MAG TPA: hypothetical protein VJN62_02215 [Gemmatimonadales bacterium]|nr:hypothetical protein [Gemmatimonadales bacterium]